MAEYIEREALIAEYDRVHIGEAGGARKLMVEAHACDVVEVVRCKDCKHFDIEEGDALGTCMGKFACISLGGELYPEPDYFCPYGERKSDDG